MPRIIPISSRRLIKLFELAGFVCVRVEGDHFILTKQGVKRPLAIPLRNSVPVHIIKSNLRSADMSRDEYLELLEKV